MSKSGKILSVSPKYAIPGGEVIIECEGVEIDFEKDFGCFFDGQKAKIVATTSSRILAIVPDNFDTHEVEIYLISGEEQSNSVNVIVGKKIVEDLHLVTNPAVDPKDDSIILTRSGSRGQSLPVTMFRLENDGFLQEISVDFLNPTGIAFDKLGQLFVTNRANGEVCRITKEEEVLIYSEDLGIATGIAFNPQGKMFIGDRSGKIFSINELGTPIIFATLEPSVSAYHLAFSSDGYLFVTAPGLSSFDVIYRIDPTGDETVFFRGLGRPQGLAFDRDGNLYVAACYKARRGIIKITPDRQAEIFVAGMNVVGLCFNRNGDVIVATNDSVYRVPINTLGILL